VLFYIFVLAIFLTLIPCCAREFEKRVGAAFVAVDFFCDSKT
jgi:hypothetical protein